MTRLVNASGLVVLWMGLVGEVTPRSLLGGILAALLVLGLSRVDVLGRPHKATLPGLLGFTAIYVWQLGLANLRIARMVLAPGSRVRSGMYAMPTEAETDLELFLLSNLNTFTPGSVVVGVEEGLFHVHVAGTGPLDRVRKSVRDNERRVLWFIR